MGVAGILRLPLAAVLLLSVASGVGAGEPLWNAFAGREGLWVRDLQGLTDGDTVWFRVARAHRTIDSGTARVNPDGRLTLPARLPEMKPGVALSLDVVLRAGGDQGRLLREGQLWAFSERPFEPGFNPAAPRSILLYDPAGRTATALRSIDLPCTLLPRLEALAEATNAVILVGEGLALEDERELLPQLAAAVRRGNDVLLLAPRDGQLTPTAWQRLVAGATRDVWPARAAGGPPYQLDLVAWPPKGRAAVARFRLVGRDDEACFAVSSESGVEAVGWDDTASGGWFRACGLGIVAQWDETPAARWLLVEMLERFAKGDRQP